MRQTFHSDLVIFEATDSQVSGYASVFYDRTIPGTQLDFRPHGVDMVTRIDPKAFDEVLASGENIEAYYSHDSASLLGNTASGTLRLSRDDKGLRFSLSVDGKDPDWQRVLPKLQGNPPKIRGASFGAHVLNSKWTKEGSTAVKTYTKLALFEISLTSIPAFEATKAILQAKPYSEPDNEERHRFLETHKRLEKFTKMTK